MECEERAMSVSIRDSMGNLWRDRTVLYHNCSSGYMKLHMW